MIGTDGLNERVARGLRAHMNEEASILNYVAGCMDSPLEQLFFVALLRCGWMHSNPNSDEWERVVRTHLDPDEQGGTVHLHNDFGAAVVAQAPVRLDDRLCFVDFAFFFGDCRIAVELDGHNFHERTKEQAARDKSRDRGLTAHGWKPIRFKGSEVWANPGRCVGEVQSVLMRHVPPGAVRFPVTLAEVIR